MACKSDASYNFARASDRDDVVYGAARPGARQQRCFNPEDKVAVEEVCEWAQFMRGHGVQRVVSLLTASEVDTYERPPAETLAGHFAAVASVDPKAPGAADKLIEALEQAAAANEKVVVHCWGGGGRTGQALAAWLVRHHGMPPEEAGQLVEAYAKAAGATRRVEQPLLAKFMGEPPQQGP